MNQIFKIQKCSCITHVEGNVRLDHVYFALMKQTHYVSKSILSLDVNQESIIVLLVHLSWLITIDLFLIPRFYEANERNVLIDGNQCQRNQNKLSLRENMGLFTRCLLIYRNQSWLYTFMGEFRGRSDVEVMQR